MITSQQYEILSRYGAGMDIESIAKHTDIDRDDVAETVTKVAGVNRQRAATAGGPTAKEIRAWAAANGVECNSHGIIPQRVRDAYGAAHAEGEAA